MNKRNNKGFTLVELLAVIVVLAVVILIASSSVLPLMEKARKNALAIEGNELVTSAQNAYQMAVMSGEITTGAACFSLQYLKDEGYFSKGSDDKYTGSVLVTPSADEKTYNYSFWIGNGSYLFTGAPVGASGEDATKGANASINCGNGTAKLFKAKSE